MNEPNSANGGDSNSNNVDDLKSGPFSLLYEAVKNNVQILINVRNNHKYIARVKAYDRHMNLYVFRLLFIKNLHVPIVQYIPLMFLHFGDCMQSFGDVSLLVYIIYRYLHRPKKPGILSRTHTEYPLSLFISLLRVSYS